MLLGTTGPTRPNLPGAPAATCQRTCGYAVADTVLCVGQQCQQPQRSNVVDRDVFSWHATRRKGADLTHPCIPAQARVRQRGPAIAARPHVPQRENRQSHSAATVSCVSGSLTFANLDTLEPIWNVKSVSVPVNHTDKMVRHRSAHPRERPCTLCHTATQESHSPLHQSGAGGGTTH